MRKMLWGALPVVLGLGGPALADCAADVAALEQQLAAEPAPAAGPEARDEAAAGSSDEAAAGSPEEVVDQMVEDGVRVEENGEDTTFASGGLAEPRESWTSGRSPEEHPAVVPLASAKQRLEEGDQEGCMAELGKARAALDEEPAAQ